METPDRRRSGSYGSSLWRLSSVMDESWAEMRSGYGHAFFVPRKVELVNRIYTWYCMGWLIKALQWKVKQAQFFFFIRQSRLQKGCWKCFSRSCRGHSRNSVLRLMQGRGGRRVCLWTMGTRKSTGNTVDQEGLDTHPHPVFTLDTWKIGTLLGQWVAVKLWTSCWDSWDTCGLGRIFSASIVHSEEWKELPFEERALPRALQSKGLPVFGKQPTWIFCDHPTGRAIYAFRLLRLTYVCVLSGEG